MNKLLDLVCFCSVSVLIFQMCYVSMGTYLHVSYEEECFVVSGM